MSSLTPPDQERRELIDKGHIKADPAHDLLTHEDWRAQGGFLSKVQQSWRRTMDDFRGRTRELEERAKGGDRSER
jgi:hypothetical protein